MDDRGHFQITELLKKKEEADLFSMSIMDYKKQMLSYIHLQNNTLSPFSNEIYMEH